MNRSDGNGAPRDFDAEAKVTGPSDPDPSELPVVARLMVEIRSDGTYTVARGAMEDALSGQRVAVEATGATPFALALSLAKSFAKAPFAAGKAMRALLKR